jgi:exonuclease III
VKLVAWNIRHGGYNHPALASSLMKHDADLIVLCEYRAQGSEDLVEQLRFFGWPHVATSRVSGIANGVAVLSRLPLEAKACPLGGSPFDMWAVEAAIQDSCLTVFGVYAPLNNSLGSSPTTQQQFWHAVRQMAGTRGAERVLLVGDFNTCGPGDGPTPSPCGDVFQHLSSVGWIDAWRACNPGPSDFSYVHRSTAPPSTWRIDHAFISPALAGSVRSCRYSHAERENKLSDHSMLIVEID